MLGDCNKRGNVPSLLTLSIDYIINHLGELNEVDLSDLETLPERIKSRMLHFFTVTPYFWAKVDFKRVFESLVHENISHLNLTACTLDDDVLNVVSKCANLRELHLTRIGKNNFTTNGLLKMFPKLKHLELLRMSQCEAVNDEVVQTIADNCLNISGIDIGGCGMITDKALISLSVLHRLQWLTCSNTQISTEGIRRLVQGPCGKHLKELRISNCPNIGESIMVIVAQHCPQMQVFVFNNCQRLSDQTFFSFQEGSFQNLKQINWTIEW